jgi:uncharacterized protein
MLFLASFSTIAGSNNTYYWLDKQKTADRLFNSGEYIHALKIYTRVAEETASSHSQFSIAWIYDHGLGVKRSCSEAVRWYTHAANNKNSAAQNNLYVLYVTGCLDLAKNPKLAVQYLKMAADSGSSRAQSNLAALYEKGDIVDKNPYIAYDLALRSSKQNDVAGILRLASYHSAGFGVPQNYKKAYALLSNAVTMEVPTSDEPTKQTAQLMFGVLHFEGRGTPRNITESYKWFLLSSAGSNQSTTEAAKEYIVEIDQLLSHKEAATVQEEAFAITGNQPIATDEDLLSALNKYLEEDKKSVAINLARTLSSRSNTDGQVILGLMHYNGYLSITKDLDEAYILFKRACKSLNWEGCAYQVGVLIDKNQVKEANQLLEHISKAPPSGDWVQLHLANLHYILGHTSEAEEAVRNVLINDPINKEAKDMLSKISKKK